MLPDPPHTKVFFDVAGTRPLMIYVHLSIRGHERAALGRCLKKGGSGRIHSLRNANEADCIIVKTEEDRAELFRNHPDFQERHVITYDEIESEFYDRPKEVRTRRLFTTEDDRNLADYIARRCPDPGTGGRNGNVIYHELVQNPRLWPWAQGSHALQWRDRYKNNRSMFNRWVAKIVRDHPEYLRSKQRYPKSQRPEDIRHGFRNEGAGLEESRRGSQRETIASQRLGDEQPAPLPDDRQGDNILPTELQVHNPASGPSKSVGNIANRLQPVQPNTNVATQQTLVDSPHSGGRVSHPTHKFPEGRRSSRTPLRSRPRPNTSQSNPQDVGANVSAQLGFMDGDVRQVSPALSSQPQRSVLSRLSHDPIPFEKNDAFADIENMSPISVDTGTRATLDIGTRPDITPPDDDAVERDGPSQATRRGGRSGRRTADVQARQLNLVTRATSKTVRADPPEHSTTQQPVGLASFTRQLLAAARPSPGSPAQSQLQVLSPHSTELPQDFLPPRNDGSITTPNIRPAISPAASSDIPRQSFLSLTDDHTTRPPQHSLNSIPFSARFPARVSEHFGDSGQNVYPPTLSPQILSRLLQMQVRFGFNSHDVYDIFLKQNRDLKATMDVLQANQEFLDADSTIDDESE